MRIGIYNETCHGSAGGSEVSVAVLAEALARNHDVEILHHRPHLTRETLSQFANVDLTKVDLKLLGPSWPELRARDLWNRYLAERRAMSTLTTQYDLFVAFVHWVPPYSAAPRNVLMVLFPSGDLDWASVQLPNHSFAWIKRPLFSLWRKWKWRSNFNCYQMRLANSEFTRRWTQKRWQLDCRVVYPPVNVACEPVKKLNRILSVGRFSVYGHRKKQIEMLRAFMQLKARQPGDWQYDCAGGCGSEEEQAFVNQTTQLAMECDANIHVNPNFGQLKNLYEQSKIFWHAAGMDIDEDRQPELTEHFGMTTVEAMAAGCVPVVIGKGGQPEIVEHGVSGFLWTTSEEWQNYTLRLMQDNSLFQKMSRAARDRARQFSRENYVNRFLSMLELGPETPAN